MRGVFDLHDPASQRMDVAVAQLSDGSGFDFRGVWFHREGDVMRCDAAGGGAGLSEGKAASLIDHARETLAELESCNPAFAAVAAPLSARFAVIDDYETGWVPVVEVVDGRLEWGLRSLGEGAD